MIKIIEVNKVNKVIERIHYLVTAVACTIKRELLYTRVSLLSGARLLTFICCRHD